MGLPKKFAKNTAQLVELLKERYPEHNWEKLCTIQGRFGQQRRLQHAITSLFPVRIPPCLFFVQTNVLSHNQGS